MSRGGPVYAFGPFEVDAGAHQLRRQGQAISVSDRYLRVLLHLAAHAGAVVSKDELVSTAWGDVAVGDNSLEQAISALRRVLGSDSSGQQYVETVPRQGYRLAATVVRTVPAVSDETLDALLAPHRALLDGRAALETLERGEIARAREVFAHVVTMTPDAAPAHVGLANACVLQFEMTRADETPDAEALRLAAHHAHEACRRVRPLITQFGWQFEKQFYSKDSGVAVVNEWVALAGGLDQNIVIPSLTWLVGVRTREGTEFGVGPNVTPAGVALAFAAGVTFRTGFMNVPMNVAVVPSRIGTRVSFLTGFTMRRR